MKNHFVAAVTIGLVSALAVTSCAAGRRAEPDVAMASEALNSWSAPCNLGLDWIQADGSWVASYSAPTLGAQTDPEGYGALVANDGCDDATILRWQGIRHESGQSDAVCRVVWERDPLGLVRDVGCAVPVLVVTP